MFYSTVCAIITASLIIVAFASAMLMFENEYGVGLLFMAALLVPAFRSSRHVAATAHANFGKQRALASLRF
jgi:hypothetical protein